MINEVCGFDQWVDNHIAIDGQGTPSLSDMAELLEQNGFHYHWWKTPDNRYQIYAVGKKKKLIKERNIETKHLSKSANIMRPKMISYIVTVSCLQLYGIQSNRK